MAITGLSPNTQKAFYSKTN